MDRYAYQRATEIFGDASELPAPEQERFLAQACGGDVELLHQVRRMIAGDLQASLLDRPALALLFPDDLRDAGFPLPAAIGGFRVLSRLGAGGMGVVYEAEQEHPRRRVALKVLSTPLATERLRRRFEQEALILGWLNHPGIAQIYEAAVAETPSGPLPFLAMELVRGEPLTSHAERRGLSTRERLELLARVCDAVEHAHQRGVIHRDLKPGNILVDASGQPKVLDFGIARATDHDLQATSLATNEGEILGTLAYMSPEQLSGKPDAIDTRADVYALGVVAFELLAGRLPHDLDGKPLPEASRLVLEREPKRLSAVRRDLAGDVSTIVAKALEKDKERRYAAARELGNDIRRFLAREPIVARPTSGLYQLRRFAQRNRGLTATLVFAGVALVAGTVVSLFQAHEAGEARELADAGQELAHRAARRSTLMGATMAFELGDLVACRGLLDSVEPAERGWEWRYLDGLTDQTSARITSGEPLRAAQFVSARDELVLVTATGEVQRWSADGVERLGSSRLEHAPIGRAAIDRDGTRIAAIFGADGSQVGLWDAASGTELATIPSGGRVLGLEMGPDGDRIAIIAGRKSFMWEPFADVPLRWVFNHDVRACAMSADGARLASLYLVPGRYYTLDYDAATGAYAHGGVGVCGVAGLAIAMDSDGHRTAATCSEKSVVLIDERTNEQVAELPGHTGAVRCAAFSPEGARLATASDDRTVRLWDLSRMVPIAVLAGLDGVVEQIAFRPSGAAVLARTERELFLWNLDEDPGPRVLCRLPSYAYAVAFAAGGSRVMALSLDGTLWILDFASGDTLWEYSELMPAKKLDDWALVTARDAPLFVSSDRNRIRVWDADAGVLVREVKVAPDGESVIALGLSADGTRLACRDWTSVSVWNPVTGERLQEWHAPSGSRFGDVALSEDGSRVAADGAGGSIFVWEVGGAEAPLVLAGHAGTVEALAFSEDGSLLASGSVDTSVRLWEARTGALVWASTAHTDRVYALAFSPDGSQLASGSNDTTIRLWDTTTGEDVGLLAGHQDYVFDLAFSPNGSALASASGDRSIRVWDTVKRRVRYSEGVRRRRLRIDAQPAVEALILEWNDPRVVADHIRHDASLDAEEREASLQALLTLAPHPFEEGR